MPLGAARLNTLSKVLTVAGSNERTLGFNNVLAKNDAQLSNAQYKFNTGTRGGSIIFDGTDDFIMTSKIATWDGSGDMTFEAFVRTNDRNGGQAIFHFRGVDSSFGGSGTYASSDSKAIIIFMDYGGDFKFYVDSGYRQDGTGEPQFTNNTWHHVAVQRKDGVWNAWVDGTRYVNYSSSTDHTATLRDYEQPIGARVISSSPSDDWNGYMDEIRISDSARYETGSSITVPTSAFTPDSNTVLLLHGDGPYGSNGNRHIVDDIGDLRPLDIHIEQNVTVNSGSAASISTAQSKFGGSSLRMNDNNSHCQYVSPAWGSAFTIEFWFRADTLSGDQYMAGVWGGSPHGGFNWTIYLNGSTVRAYVWNGSYQLNNANVGTASANTWHHVALTWDGSTYRTFLDGTAGGSNSSSTAPAFDQWQVTWVGTVGGTTSTFAGYIDEYRQSDTARYTSNFSPSGSAFTDDANTKVLLHFDGSNGDTTTIDGDPPARAGAAVRYVDLGGTSVSSTGGKFGGAASGSNDAADYIETNPGGSWTLDSDQIWTVEFFFKTSSSFSPTSNITLAGLNFGNISGIRLEANTNGQLKAFVAGSGNSYSFNHSTSYQHLAWVSDGAGTVKFYLDGVEQISYGFYSYNMSSPTDKRFYYGSTSGASGQPTYSFDELRISRVQRYTSGFTPTTTAFTNDEDTVALFHFDNNYDDDNS